MADFAKFSKVVSDKFDEMNEGNLFKVCVDSDELYQTYLNAFPEGTNPLYRERTSHDCSCCRQFIKNIGKVVSIVDGEITTVWDVETDEYPYNIVAQKMHEFVSKHKIQNVYKATERKYGAEFTLELLEDQTTHRWDHFVGKVQQQHFMKDPASYLSNVQTSFKVFKRGLEEITIEALETVRDLIQDNALYRGQEHANAVDKFLKCKREFDACETDKNLYVWKEVADNNFSARFRNTVIGTLVVDLSDGVSLEDAVKMFESKVAPANYKRPKALVTPKMVEQAMETIRELDLEPALNRRHAKFSDVSVEDVLFVDNKVQGKLVGGLEETLLKSAKKSPVKVKNSVDITAKQFINEVLPKAVEIKALVKNSHVGNFASLTAPVNLDVSSLFKWDNNFAWSYSGNVADSNIKERVKKAGGSVNAHLRCSLSWFNTDDLDIHARHTSGQHIFFSNKLDVLDVDMNACACVRDPVENLAWSKSQLKDGIYTISVNNYTKRESVDYGFTLEVEFDGTVCQYHYKDVVGNGETVQALALKIENKCLVGVKVLNNKVSSEEASKEVWGVPTETFVEVSSVVLSPNHWGSNSTGNKHLFFILDGCKNPDSVRGIYNEYLNSSLEKHRKVFEIIGEKTKCEPCEDQMSGLGFSSTKKANLTVQVKSDKTQQTYNIAF